MSTTVDTLKLGCLEMHAVKERLVERRLAVCAVCSKLFLLLDKVTSADEANDHLFSELGEHVEHLRRRVLQH